MMLDELGELLTELMLIPGLAGHEDRVRRTIAGWLGNAGLPSSTDRLGNLTVTLEGDAEAPGVMVFAHMDQLGFVVRRIDPDGMIRVSRLGGVPERTLASQAVTVCAGNGNDVDGVIGNMSHHATPADERHAVLPVLAQAIDTGHGSRQAVENAGIRIGDPVVYKPTAMPLAGNRVAGTCIDDRAGCAALMVLARLMADMVSRPTVHIVFSVQEEFNLRGAEAAARILRPDVAIQIDLMLATDTPGLEGLGSMRLGGGPGISLYSFHGRGTLNGVIPHPAMVRLFETTAETESIPLQRSAQVGVLTDLSYVQLTGDGVAAMDVGFPLRYSHSSLEVCDLSDLVDLIRLLEAAIARIGPGFDLSRNGGRR